MSDALQLLAGVPNFLAYFGFALILFLLFAVIYMRATPHNELALIRNGNVAASVAFSGALFGFALPLCSAIAHSVSLIDAALWGALALVIQVVTFFVIRLVVPRLSQQIATGMLSGGIFVAAMSIAVGMINAACLTY
jgi:putative membrane protein